MGHLGLALAGGRDERRLDVHLAPLDSGDDALDAQPRADAHWVLQVRVDLHREAAPRHARAYFHPRFLTHTSFYSTNTILE